MKKNTLNLDKNLIQIFKNRGFSSLDEIQDFLSRDKLSSSSNLSSISIITKRIKDSFEKNEKIIICGDYDVDGATSTAMLFRFFKEANHPNFDWFIPNRFDDGYGLSENTVQDLSSSGCKIIITVDNGIASHAAAIKAKELGIDLIITDHHDIVDNLPVAFAILNPKLDENHKARYLAGAGVVFYLLNEMNKDLNLKIDLKKYLCMAMIASITDVVPLLDDNRVLVKAGLKMMSKNLIPGLRALFEELKIPLTSRTTAKDIGFRIGPVLNAPGRIGGADKTFKLLIEDDPFKITKLIDQLILVNEERKNISNSAIEKYKNSNDDHKILIIQGEDLHQGIIGIVAARLKENFNKPVIVISIDKETRIGKASCRSLNGLNIKDVIESSKNHLGGGGHYMAAGFSIREDQIEDFKKDVYDYVNSLDFNPIEDDVELHLTKKDLNEKFLLGMKEMEPFGAKFEYPKVSYTGVVKEIRILKNEHILLKMDKNLVAFKFFAKLNVDINKYKEGSTVKITGELSVSGKEFKIIIS